MPTARQPAPSDAKTRHPKSNHIGQKVAAHVWPNGWRPSTRHASTTIMRCTLGWVRVKGEGLG